MTIVVASALAGHQFLHGMPGRHLESLAGVSALVTVPAGHRVFEAGQVARHFWLIRTGQVALDVQVPSQGRLVVETLGRGEILGISWFFPPYQWQFGATSMQPTEAFEVDAAAVRRRCQTDRDFGYEFTRRLIAAVSRRLQAARTRMVDVRSGQSSWS